MKSPLPTLAAAIVGLCLHSTSFALEQAFIAFKAPVSSALVSELNAKGVTAGRVIPTINAVAVAAPRELLESYAQDPRVRAVTLQRQLQLHTYSSRPQIQADQLQAPESLKDSSGATLERPGVTGKGVTVAVIDTGIFALHPDFGVPGSSRVVTGLNFELSLANRMLGVLPVEAWDGYAQASGASALEDEVGHGTHVAGIIGGDGFAASGLAIGGVAPEVNFVSVRIASPGNGVVEDIGFEANAVAAIDYLIRHREDLGNVGVVNNSWGLLANEAQGLLGPTDFDPVAEVVRAAVDAGIVMVFSAGNDGPEPDTVRPIPNGMDEVISVASACKADRGSCSAGGLNDFSSRGPSVDITAPGDQIISASSPSVLEPLGQTLEGEYFGDSPQDELQNRVAYTRLSGTSMSAPHVSGVAALILQANPQLSPAQVRQVMIETADDMVLDGDPELLPGYDVASGWGMINARMAVAKAAAYGDSAPARSLSNSAGGALGGIAVSLVLLAGLRRRRHN